jgi:uncharacterized membrane protein
MTDTNDAGAMGGAGGVPPAGAGTMPKVRRVSAADVRAALAAGIDDFRAAPLYGFLFGGLYTLGGLLLIAAVTRLHLPWLAYPLAAGFALIGPFVAVGLYEVSRRLAAKEPLSMGSIFGVVFAQRGRELGWMAFVTLFVFLMWMYQIRLLLALFLGFKSFSSLTGFLTVVFTTPEGLMFLAVGHVVGAALALIVFSITVISMPLLLDRDVDFITAMITSVKVVATSPVPMLGWGVVVAVALVVGSLPMFAGLLIVLPVLGHTTWHLYKRAVEPPAPA